MKEKVRVGLIYGGRSAEHEISLRSARSILNALDKNKYEVVPIAIDSAGRWLIEDAKQPLLLTADRVTFPDSTSSNGLMNLVPQGKAALPAKAEAGESNRKKFDVVFPVLHGPFGEDGTVQGLLKLANIPYVGADVLGSAVGMDKDVMKRLLVQAGIPSAKFITIRRGEINRYPYSQVQKQLGSTVFIKPANLGSSVGVSKAQTESEFNDAVASAFRFDNKVLVEEYIRGREIEISVLGNEEPIASVAGEIIPSHEFYSYEAKYLDENGAQLIIPAKIDQKILKQIQEIAVETFKILCCEGMARIDFFLTENGSIYVNEINTIPGFTSISMYPKLWEASGIAYSELLDRLIELAMKRHERDCVLICSYGSS